MLTQFFNFNPCFKESLGNVSKIQRNTEFYSYRLTTNNKNLPNLKIEAFNVCVYKQSVRTVMYKLKAGL